MTATQKKYSKTNQISMTNTITEKDEAEQTVRKQGLEYEDIAKTVELRNDTKHISDEQFAKILSNIQIRYTLTPACNLWCSFCSNEGLNYAYKNKKHADTNQIIQMTDMLKNHSLKMIALTGGEPTIHPDFIRKEYRIAEMAETYPDVRFSIHTNGTSLESHIIDKIYKSFSRIGVSVNSLNRETWKKITNHTGQVPNDMMNKKYYHLLQNLNYLKEKNIGHKVFIKAVVMRGINDSHEDLNEILQYCKENKFHPKFFELEPQYESDLNLVVPRKELFEKLKDIGCTFDSIPINDEEHYFPNANFAFNGAQLGLHSLFGCGKKAACKSCYDYLPLFVKPSEDGKGLYIKPCSVLDTRLDLTRAIETKNESHLIELIKLSREYLKTMPGIGATEWNKEKGYSIKEEK